MKEMEEFTAAAAVEAPLAAAESNNNRNKRSKTSNIPPQDKMIKLLP